MALPIFLDNISFDPPLHFTYHVGKIIKIRSKVYLHYYETCCVYCMYYYIKLSSLPLFLPSICLAFSEINKNPNTSQ